MRKLFLVCCLLFTVYCFAQPKLVVGIVVDQMRYDYIRKYWKKFGNDGFKRLVNEGYSCTNTNYNYVPTFTGPGHASIYTGATPVVNGIVSNHWIENGTKEVTYCVDDKSVSAVGGNNSAGQMSPKNLLSSTIGEGLKKFSLNKSKVIGIALKDRGAILPAGHNANAAYWYEGSNGNWISSTYYMKELPQWVSDFNKKESAKKYLSQTWTTFLPIEQYTESDADDNNCEEPFKGKAKPTFPYNLSALMKENGELGLLRSTPFGNSFTNDFAIETIRRERLGKGNATDLLCVSFSSTDYIGHQFGPQSVEVEDCYIRLDKDIAALLKFLDEWVGKNNALVFLTSDHGAGESFPCMQKKNIPSGVMDEKTISDSLKRFFLRVYGDTSLLAAVLDYDVYLNNNKIEEKKINPDEVRNKTANYLLSMNGIADAITSADIQKNNFGDSIRSKVKEGFNPPRCGDVIFVLKPHWLEGYRKGTSHGSPYIYDTHVPLLWWGGNIPHGSSNEAITITQIAPTVSALLKMPNPNGCTSKPIIFSPLVIEKMR
ncbi:MAG: alkaline phosphatase family protein [Bacteroidetes bacterium]|nr:alkaline phosphatase family protein [Bacteroidota bacterium]